MSAEENKQKQGIGGMFTRLYSNYDNLSISFRKVTCIVGVADLLGDQTGCGIGFKIRLFSVVSITEIMVFTAIFSNS
jgi:hypothetical protein